MDFKEFWEKLNHDDEARSKDNFSAYAHRLMDGLLTALLNEEEVNIGCRFKGKKHWSMLLYDFYDNNKWLALQMNQKEKIQLYYHFWNDERLLDEIFYSLTPEEESRIPEGLKNLMRTALNQKEYITVSRKMIK